MKPKISVIVPVYNVEPYLKRCLDSIINQSLNEIEILIIDDGSTDKSGEICDEYAKLDNRIRVIHQENGGLSRARNVGLDQAQGKYIMFVDSDDLLKEIFVKSLMILLKNTMLTLLCFAIVISLMEALFLSLGIMMDIQLSLKTAMRITCMLTITMASSHWDCAVGMVITILTAMIMKIFCRK